MPDYTAIASTVDRLIRASGRAVTVVKFEETLDDPSKPWRATTTPRDAASTISLLGVFVSPFSLTDFGFASENYVNDMLVGMSGKVVILPASSAGGELLETYNEVLDGQIRYGIAKTHILEPGGVRLLYAMELSK